VERIDVGPKGLSLAFRNNEFSRPEQLVAWIASKAGEVQLRADHKLVMQRTMPAADGRPAICKQIVQELIALGG
jgi:transcription-repair coupling factor (superfamily II helicase)